MSLSTLSVDSMSIFDKCAGYGCCCCGCRCLCCFYCYTCVNPIFLFVFFSLFFFTLVFLQLIIIFFLFFSFYLLLFLFWFKLHFYPYSYSCACGTFGVFLSSTLFALSNALVLAAIVLAFDPILYLDGISHFSDPIPHHIDKTRHAATPSKGKTSHIRAQAE